MIRYTIDYFDYPTAITLDEKNAIAFQIKYLYYDDTYFFPRKTPDTTIDGQYTYYILDNQIIFEVNS